MITSELNIDSENSNMIGRYNQIPVFICDCQWNILAFNCYFQKAFNNNTSETVKNFRNLLNLSEESEFNEFLDKINIDSLNNNRTNIDEVLLTFEFSKYIMVPTIVNFEKKACVVNILFEKGLFEKHKDNYCKSIDKSVFNSMLFNLPSIDILMFDSKLNLLIVGGTEMQKFGFNPKSLINKNLHEYFKIKPFDFIEEICHSVLSGEKISTERDYLEQTYLLEGIPIYNDDDNIIENGLITVQNISLRKSNELSIKYSEEKYKQLFENSFDAILIVDYTTNIITDTNQAACQLLELDSDEIIGQSKDNIMQLQNIHRYEGDKDVIETGITLLNKKHKVVRIKSAAIELFGKKYSYILLQNITEQINAESDIIRFAEDLQESKIRLEEQAFELIETNETLFELNEKLEKMIENNNVFMAITAHDLKNPIAAVNGFLELLTTYGESIDANDRNKLMNSAKVAIDQAFALISDILEINSIDEGKARVTVVDCLGEDVLRDTIATMKPLADNKFIEIILTIDAENSKLRLDKERLERILQNIISNAIKFSPFKKKIYITLQNVVDSSDLDNYLLIIVKDEGPGIMEENMSKLFSKYTKLNAKPTGGESSTGIGLYIVKSLTELLNGQVWCESVYGEGAAFYLKIPVYQ